MRPMGKGEREFHRELERLSAAFVDEQGTDKRFFYPENLPVQWAAEWGLPVALALLVIIVWSIARGFRLRRSHAHVGGLAGLVAIGIHQLADFSLVRFDLGAELLVCWTESEVTPVPA